MCGEPSTLTLLLIAIQKCDLRRTETIRTEEAIRRMSEAIMAVILESQENGPTADNEANCKLNFWLVEPRYIVLG